MERQNDSLGKSYQHSDCAMDTTFRSSGVFNMICFSNVGHYHRLSRLFCMYISIMGGTDLGYSVSDFQIRCFCTLFLPY